MIETIVAAGIPISGKVAMEIEKAKKSHPDKTIDSIIPDEEVNKISDNEISSGEDKKKSKKKKLIKKSADENITDEEAKQVLNTKVKDTIDEDDGYGTDDNVANATSTDKFDPNKRYTKAQKLQLAIDFCDKNSGFIFSETKDLPATVTEQDKEKYFKFDSTVVDENIYFLYKKTSGGTLCGRTKFAYTFDPARESEFYQSLHQSSKKLNGDDNENLASGAKATSIQERIIGAYINAFLTGKTQNAPFYILDDVLYPDIKKINSVCAEGYKLFDESNTEKLGIDHSWKNMFDKLFRAFQSDANDTSHKAEFNFTELKDRSYVCIHPDMPNLSSDLKKLFASGISGSATQKDTVIPADLYLIKTSLVNQITHVFKKAKDLESLCALTNYCFGTISFNDLMTIEKIDIKNSYDLIPVQNANKSRQSAILDLSQAAIIPISLKKNESAPSVYLIMNTSNNVPKVKIEDIEEIVFNESGNSYFTAAVDKNKSESEFRKHFGNKNAYFEFRWKNTGAKWQCNATVVDAKDALLGGSVKEVAQQSFTENKIAFFGENKVDFTEEDINSLYSTFENKIMIKYDKKEAPKPASLEDLKNLHNSMLGNAESASSSKAGRCGLFQILISLLRQSNKDATLSDIVAKSFKMDPSVQDTVKIM